MNLADRIDTIIDERKKSLPKIDSAQNRLIEVYDLIERLDAFRDNLDEAASPELYASLSSISTTEFKRDYKRAYDALENIKKRFSREEINISFVGRAGQGKSLALQKISGLDSSVIPSADGSDCTGARSVISNDQHSVNTSAQITFFTESEMVNIVNIYLQAITGNKELMVGSLAGIGALDISKIRSNLAPEQELQKNLLTHLEKYIEHIGELSDLLGQTIVVGKDDIERYIAQYKKDDKSIKYYNYLGVKEAIIKSPFPFKDAGKIVLVDTIGTGATSLGVEEDLLETAKNGSDAIVIMKRPEPLRPRMTREDYELLQKISNELSPEYTNKLLFWLFNRVEAGKGANKESIPELMAQVNKENLAVAKVVDVDCSKEAEVRERLLIPLLEQMASNLHEIDAMLIERVNEKLRKVNNDFTNIATHLNKAINASLTPDERRHFYQHNQALIKRMTNSLRELYRHLNAQKGFDSADLQTIASEKLRSVLTCVPPEDEIIAALNDGTMNQHEVLQYFADEIRLKIINEFLNLDSVLQKIVVDAKRAVVNILASDEGGKLSDVAGCPTDNPDIWLEKFRDKIDPTMYPTIRNALAILREFDLSVENFLIYKVRICLNGIDWNLKDQPPQLYNVDDKAALADEIIFILQDLLESIHSQIKKQLKDYYSFPNEAIFAATRDFCDRISSNVIQPSTQLTPLEEWRRIYEDFIPVIWRDERLKFGAQQAVASQWRELIDSFENCNKETYLLVH